MGFDSHPESKQEVTKVISLAQYSYGIKKKTTKSPLSLHRPNREIIIIVIIIIIIIN